MRQVHIVSTKIQDHKIRGFFFKIQVCDAHLILWEYPFCRMRQICEILVFAGHPVSRDDSLMFVMRNGRYPKRSWLSRPGLHYYNFINFLTLIYSGLIIVPFSSNSTASGFRCADDSWISSEKLCNGVFDCPGTFKNDECGCSNLDKHAKYVYDHWSITAQKIFVIV